MLKTSEMKAITASTIVVTWNTSRRTLVADSDPTPSHKENITLLEV